MKNPLSYFYKLQTHKFGVLCLSSDSEKEDKGILTTGLLFTYFCSYPESLLTNKAVFGMAGLVGCRLASSQTLIIFFILRCCLEDEKIERPQSKINKSPFSMSEEAPKV